MDAVDEKEWQHRRAMVHLTLQFIQDHEAKFGLDILKTSQDKIDKITLQSTISELFIWRSICRRLDLAEKAKNYADAILLLEPENSLDCQLLINGFVEGKQLQKAISTAEAWLLANRNDSSVRTRYISLVEDNGTPEQADKVIEETRAWLLENEDSSVRTRYISLVDARGSDKQVEEVIDETEAWLLEKENSAVRTRHISLVRKKGSDEQLKRAIINSMIWLKDSNSDIFSAYLSLVRDRDFLDPEIIKRTLTNTEERMKKDKTQIDQLFLGYLSMVRKIRKTKIDVLVDIDLVKNFGYQYISSCNSLVPINDFARWLSEEKFFDDSIEIFEKLSKEEKLSNKIKREIHFGFGMAYLGQAMNPHLADYQHLNALKKSEEQFREVVRINKGDIARSYLAIVLREQKQFEEAAREFKHVEWWSRNGRYVPYSPGKLFSEIGKFYRKFNRYGEAIFWYEKAINEEPDVFANWWGLGRARMGMAEELIKQKKDIHAEKMLNRALKELETALEKSPRPLQLPASRDLPDQIAKCKKLYLLYKY